jgi:hypothetical protein
MQLFSHSRFTASDCGHVWMFINIKGFVNQLCDKTPTDLRMGVPAQTTNFDGMNGTLTETQRKAAINAPYQFGQDARKLEDWWEMQPQSFVMLGINRDTYAVVVRVTSQFFQSREQLVALP